MSVKVCVLKMINGDEVIAKAELEGGIWHCEDPCVFKIYPNQQTGHVQTGLIPFFMSGAEHQNAPIKDSMVVSWIDAPEELARHYLSTVSGIAIAGAGSILK